MNKDLISRLAASAIIMLLLPWLAVTFVKGDGGMAVCFLLFYAVNPVHSVVTGIFAGKNMRKRWFLPIITAVLFLIGTWIFFTPDEAAFILYAGVYLLFGMFAMFLSWSIQYKMCNKTETKCP